MVFHGFWLVSMGFQGGFMVFMVFGWFPWFLKVVSWFLLGFHGFSRWFYGFSWFLVGFHGFSRWFHGLSWFLVGFHVFQGSFIFFHGFWLVSMFFKR